MDFKQCGGDVRAVRTERHPPPLPVGIPRMLQQCGNRPSSHHPPRLFSPRPTSPVCTKLTSAAYWTWSKRCRFPGRSGRKKGRKKDGRKEVEANHCCCCCIHLICCLRTEKGKKGKSRKVWYRCQVVLTHPTRTILLFLLKRRQRESHLRRRQLHLQLALDK